jgi:hypothetical protein
MKRDGRRPRNPLGDAPWRSPSSKGSFLVESVVVEVEYDGRSTRTWRIPVTPPFLMKRSFQGHMQLEGKFIRRRR